MNPFAMNGGNDGPSGFNFEGFEGMQSSGEIPVAPEAVSVDEFNESWRVNLHVENEPAGGVLESLATGLSLELESGSDVAEALSQPVSLSLEGVSRFAAVDAVCTIWKAPDEE